MVMKRLLEHAIQRFADKAIDTIFTVKFAVVVLLLVGVSSAEILNALEIEILPDGTTPSEIMATLWDLIERCTEECFGDP